MRKPLLFLGVLAITALPFAAPSRTASAADLGWLNPANLLKGTPVDVHRPEASRQCGHEGCIERVPVEDCVTGEKKVYKTTVRREYVAIPEVRYKWEMRWVTKEIPCDYCKPVCETENVDHAYQSERWDKKDLGCSELHCKSCEPKTEKMECKKCKTEPGKTTAKVHYWSCVKVPYTVYRQVEREVCVKQPRYEKVEVPVTRYICRDCGGIGCKRCCQRDETAVAEMEQ
jgi:hypothetical protein